MITNDIMIRPKCDCHGAEMFWAKNKRHSKGGYWRCFVKKREQQAIYRKTPAGKISEKTRKQRWAKTPHGKKSIAARDKKYLQTENGKIVNRAASKRYTETPRGFLKKYLAERSRDLAAARIKAESDLIDVRKQIKELELVIKQG